MVLIVLRQVHLSGACSKPLDFSFDSFDYVQDRAWDELCHGSKGLEQGFVAGGN